MAMRFRRKCDVDYDAVVTIPFHDDSGKCAFRVDVYGMTSRDLILPGGLRPVERIIERLGLDPQRIRANIWEARDVPAYGDLDERGEDDGNAGNLR